MPKLSIITINLNNKEGLLKTLTCVFSQTFTDYEYIVIDGGSTDGSVQLIKEYADKITYWVSEPDKGIYNAMNKGIVRASGDLVCFINSGDEYFSNESIEIVLKSIAEIDQYCWIYFFDYINKSSDQFKIQVSSSDVDNKARIFIKGFGHPSTFYRKEIFNYIGNFDESFIIVGDREFNLRAFLKHKLKFAYFAKPVSIFNEGGISTNPKYSNLLKREEERLRNEYFNKIERILFGNGLFQKLYSITFFHLILKISINW